MYLGEYNPYLALSEDLLFTGNRKSAMTANGSPGPTGPQGPRGKSATTASGSLKIGVVPDSLAETNTLYYSFEKEKLIFKDKNGDLFVVQLRPLS